MENIEMTKTKCRAFRKICARLSEENGVMGLDAEQDCGADTCPGICERYRMEQQSVARFLKGKQKMGEPVETGNCFREISPEEGFLWTLEGWEPTASGVLSLMDAGVATAEELARIGLPRMESAYGLADRDAQQLLELLRSLGYNSRRSMGRPRYDDFRRCRR